MFQIARRKDSENFHDEEMIKVEEIMPYNIYLHHTMEPIHMYNSSVKVKIFKN
jgi:hypothetical protein